MQASRKAGIDLRYHESSDRFEVSQQVKDQLDLGTNGINFYAGPQGQQLVMSVQEREASTFMRGRKEEPTKTNHFSAKGVRQLADRVGLEGVNEFSLEIVHEENDVIYLAVTEWQEGQISNFSPLNQVDNTTEEEAEETVETVEQTDEPAFSQYMK